jgi:8-oxo-dGTP pyrophosphatase MutT (NUDIX family)
MYTLSLGRADTLAETPFQTARREAWEEIGLPNIDSPLPGPFAVEHLCEMPANLAKTELVVRPCIALLHAHDERTGESADPEVSLIPKLDAREVAAVFTAPFEQFLSMRDEGLAHPPDWYQGSWSSWHNSNWRSKSIHHTSRSSVTFNSMRVRSMSVDPLGLASDVCVFFSFIFFELRGDFADPWFLSLHPSLANYI